MLHKWVLTIKSVWKISCFLFWTSYWRALKVRERLPGSISLAASVDCQVSRSKAISSHLNLPRKMTLRMVVQTLEQVITVIATITMRCLTVIKVKTTITIDTNKDRNRLLVAAKSNWRIIYKFLGRTPHLFLWQSGKKFLTCKKTGKNKFEAPPKY